MGEATTRRFQSVWLKVSLGLAVLAVAFLAGLWRPWFGDTPDKQPDGPVKANSPEVQPSASAVPSHILALWKKLPADAPMPATAPFDAEAAARFQQEWAAYLKLPVEFTNSVGIRFRLIPPGGFDMGCDPLESAQQLAAAGGMAFWEECIRSQSPKHHVAVTEPFYLATTEVTQAQYESVMSRNPSVFSSSGPAAAEVAGLDTLDWPVEGLSWKNAAAFCRALSLRDGLQPTYEFEGDQTNISASAGGYALPTEAQWEMACRAGSVTRYWTGNDAEGLKAAAHFGGGLGHPAPVGQLKPNPFGLYDVHGNVNEWVQDGWLPDYYKQCAAEPLTVDPTGPPESPWHRITKGGDFHYSEGECLSAARFAHDATTIPIYADGVRPVLPWKAVPAALAVRQRAAAEQTDDFVEVHGATLSELRLWLDQLPPSFMPHYFGVRHGSQPPLLDAVASRQANPLPWQVHLTSDFEADFQSMRAEHRTAWRITVPSADPSQDAPTALALWIADDGVPWSTWPIEEEVIETRLAEMSDEGYLPVCLSAAMLEGQRWWELSLRQVPGVGHHTYLELTPEDFIQKVEHYRARHWRPHLIQAVLPSAEFKLTAVFRENYSEIEWQVAMLIDQAEYEQQLTLRKKQGFYPAQVVSVLRDGQPQFIVLWCRGRAVPFEPEDESVAETR